MTKITIAKEVLKTLLKLYGSNPEAVAAINEGFYVDCFVVTTLGESSDADSAVLEHRKRAQEDIEQHQVFYSSFDRQYTLSLSLQKYPAFTKGTASEIAAAIEHLYRSGELSNTQALSYWKNVHAIRRLHPRARGIVRFMEGDNPVCCCESVN